MPYNVSFISLGCAKNQVNCEQMMATVQHAGHNVVLSPEGADVAVVNTCGFLASACEEAIDNILEMAELKKEGKLKKIIVTGCMAQRYKDDVLHELPEVDAVLGTGSYGEIARAVDEVMAPGGLRPCYMGDIQNCVQGGARILSTPSWYAYLRIAEGCNNFCAFCAIPLITGNHKSRPIEEIEQEVRELVEKGVKEFNVIAQDLSAYGTDLPGRQQRLPELVERLAKIDGVKWIRLHYAYPASFPMDLLRVMRENDNVCSYIDIALQHSSDHMLSAMHRHITAAETNVLLDEMRRQVPGLHIRTTLMVGFPGETEDDFKDLLRFVREERFERMGAFAYCEEEGTFAANNYTDDVPEEVKQQRLDKLMALQEEISLEIQQQKVGQELEVVIDREEEEYYVGRTQWDSPEVDPEVLVEKTATMTPGNFYRVKITQALPFELIATPVTV